MIVIVDLRSARYETNPHGIQQQRRKWKDSTNESTAGI